MATCRSRISEQFYVKNPDFDPQESQEIQRLSSIVARANETSGNGVSRNRKSMVRYSANPAMQTESKAQASCWHVCTPARNRIPLQKDSKPRRGTKSTLHRPRHYLFDIAWPSKFTNTGRRLIEESQLDEADIDQLVTLAHACDQVKSRLTDEMKHLENDQPASLESQSAVRKRARHRPHP